MFSFKSYVVCFVFTIYYLYIFEKHKVKNCYDEILNV